MIEEPGSFSGRRSSPRPARGPEPSQRTSLAIFMRSVASVLRAPEAKVVAPWPARPTNLLGIETKGRPVSSAIRAATRSANSGWALRPVPTAVPPRAISWRPGQRRPEPGEVAVEHRHVAGELLAEGERHGVLEVGPADLHDPRPGLGLGVEGVAQGRHRRDEPLARSRSRRPCGARSGTCRSTTGSCSRGRSGGSASCRRATPSPARWPGPAMTSLTFMFDWVPEPVCQTRSGNSAARVPSITSSAARTTRSRLSAGRSPRSAFTSAAALLEDPEGADDRDRHRVAADREVVEGALGLRAPVVVGRDLDRAHRVGLGAGRGRGSVRVDGGHFVPRWLVLTASVRWPPRPREGGPARSRGPTGRASAAGR